MVLPTVEVLMSLWTLAQLNHMATKDTSVLCKMTAAALQLFSSSTELSTPKPKMMKGAKATGLNLPRLLNLQVLFAMMRSSYPMDMGFLLLAMVCMMTLT